MITEESKMKTYVKRIPFPEGVSDQEEFVSLVLSEQETFWVYAEDNPCYPFMHGLMEKKIKEAQKRYKKPVRVFDTHGVIVREVA